MVVPVQFGRSTRVPGKQFNTVMPPLQRDNFHVKNGHTVAQYSPEQEQMQKTRLAWLTRDPNVLNGYAIEYVWSRTPGNLTDVYVHTGPEREAYLKMLKQAGDINLTQGYQSILEASGRIH